MVWDLAETGVTIIAASIPALRLLFRQVRRGGTKLSGSGGPNRYAMSNLKQTNVARPKCLESQNDDHDDVFEDGRYAAATPAADARSDKGILETRVVEMERHEVGEKGVRREPWE